MNPRLSINLPNSPFIFSRLAVKLENGEPTLAELELLNQNFEEYQYHFFDEVCKMQEKIAEKHQEIHECELQDLLVFWENSNHVEGSIAIKHLPQKILKFFTSEYDERPESQQRALKIYSLCPEYYSQEDMVIITQQEISLVFRMVNRFIFEGIKALYNLVYRIHRSPEQPENIILIIEKFGSFNLIEKMLRIDTIYEFTGTIGNIVIEHGKAFANYVECMRKRKTPIEEKLSQSIHLKFLNMASIFVKYIAKDLSPLTKQYFLRFIIQMYKSVPAFDFSFENYYLHPDLIEEKYIEAQDKVAKDIYQLGILTKLHDIYNIQEGWQNNRILQTMNLIIRYVSINEFQTQIIPFLMAYFQKDHATKRETYPLASLLISFIYINEELNEQQNKKQNLIDLLCDSGIFNNVIDTIDSRIERIMYIAKFGDRFQQKRIETSLNLFYMVVLAFEIIENCGIHESVYEQTVDLLKNAVKFVKQILIIQWPRKVLDQLLSNFNKELTDQKIKYHPYNIRQWQSI